MLHGVKMLGRATPVNETGPVDGGVVQDSVGHFGQQGVAVEPGGQGNVQQLEGGDHLFADGHGARACRAEDRSVTQNRKQYLRQG